MRRAHIFATFMCRLSRNPGSLNFLELQGPVHACTGLDLPKTCLVSKGQTVNSQSFTEEGSVQLCGNLEFFHYS